MTTTISLQDMTKAELDDVLSAEGHTSLDSAVKSLLLYRELYLHSQAGRGVVDPAATRNTSKTKKPTHHTEYNHCAYIGKIGSGKTFTSKYHIHHQLEDDSDHEVIVVDPLGSYEEFTKRHGGRNIGLAEVIGDPFTFNADETTDDIVLKWAVEAGVPFVLSVLGDRGYDATNSEKKLLLERVESAFEGKGTVSLSDVADVKYPEVPVDIERDVDREIVEAMGDEDCPALNTQFPHAFPNDQLVNIIPDNQMLHGTTGLIGGLLVAFSAAADRDAPVDVYVDNSQYLMENESGRQIINFLLRVGRHHDVYLNFISQGIEEFLVDDGEATIAPFDLIRTVFLHRMDAVSEVTRTELGLSKAEVAYISDALTGTTGEYSEILVGTDGSWNPRRIQVSEDLQKFIDP